MIDAAEAVLEKYGEERTTLARVARQARVSPANVYRRFRDKDALIAAVFNRFYEINSAELAQPVDTETVRALGIRQFTRHWIAAMIQGFRARTGLVRAAVLYSQTHPNAPHVKRKTEIELKLYRRMVQLFLLWRDEVRHPDPENAIGYAMLTVTLTLRELIIFGHAESFSRVVPVDDDHLREELPRAFLRYLGIEPE
jgi:AcrR family transcriptional regulator